MLLSVITYDFTCWVHDYGTRRIPLYNHGLHGLSMILSWLFKNQLENVDLYQKVDIFNQNAYF